MKTYSRDDWTAAQEAWADFSPEWREVRHQAAMRGILYPPSGTAWDSWDDDSPSQRAILIRAIRETPKLLSTCIARSRSWSDVIARLTAARDDWRAELALAQSRLERDHDEAQASHRESVTTLATILRRIGDSL
jgi:hypothetical protein